MCLRHRLTLTYMSFYMQYNLKTPKFEVFLLFFFPSFVPSPFCFIKKCVYLVYLQFVLYIL